MVLRKFLGSNWFILGLLTFLSLPAVISLINHGFYEPHDLHHFADIYQMVRAISSGQIPPRLGPDFAFGYGYPLFNFYYLLPFYLGALFFFLIGNLTFSFKAVFLVSALISVYGMYLFLKEFVGRYPAVVGSLLFLYTPYRAVQIYVRGAMGEALALSFLPFVAWGILGIIKNPKNLKIIGWGSFIISLFLLSHNYLWALSLPWFVFFCLIIIEQNWSEKIKRLLGVGALALGLSFYWLFPALIEQKLVRSITPFPLIEHFPFIKQLIIPSWGYGSSVWGPNDGLSFQIGVVNLMVLFTILGLFIFKRRLFGNNSILKLTIWSLIGFFVNFALMNVRTYPLWRLIPFYDFVQFPWRLLIFTTFFTSILAAVLVDAIKNNKKLIGVIIVGVSILLTLNYFRPSKIFYKSDNEYLVRFFADTTLTGEKKEVSQEYLNYSEDYLLLPIWAERRPDSLPPTKIQSTNKVKVTDIVKINPVHWEARISAPEEAKVAFNSYYFPGWFAKIDGKKAEISAGKPFSQIELIVPSGEHKVEFYWAETSLRKLSDLISLASFLVLMGIFAHSHKKVNIKKN